MRHTKPKLFRDPVHDIIAFDQSEPEGRLLLALVDCPEVQRLRRIRQLALSFLVYHGAEHSRFSHSIGVSWVARAMMNELTKSHPISVEERLVTLAASLLHDVGHGPFSHAMEAVTGAHHESRSIGLIRHPESHIHRTLQAFDGTLAEKVADRVVGGGEGPPFLRQIVSGQLDADRLDYILRDGHATGVKIGSFDLARILTLLSVEDEHLAIHQGATEAVEGYLLARFHMYKQVYLHRTSRAAERMLRAVLSRAASLHAAGVRLNYWPPGPLGKLLSGATLDHPEYATMDDADIWTALKTWVNEDDRPLSDLARGLTTRKIWKTFPLDADPEAAERRIAIAREVARAAGYDVETAVLVDTCRDSPYRPYTGTGAGARSIRVVDGQGDSWFIEERSAFVGLMTELVHEQRRLCVHPDLREALATRL